jgi:hypothetical protein
MGKPKPHPDLYKRAAGYGRLAAIADLQDKIDNPQWTPVAGFPEYEVNRLRHVRRTSTGAFIQPYKYMMRPNEGMFVDFWISGQKHAISLDAIHSAAFPKGEG